MLLLNPEVRLCKLNQLSLLLCWSWKSRRWYFRIGRWTLNNFDIKKI